MSWTTHCIMCIVPSILQENYGNPWTKNKTEDAGLKKFIVGKFLDYKMLDSKTVIS